MSVTLMHETAMLILYVQIYQSVIQPLKTSSKVRKSCLLLAYACEEY